MHILVVFLDIDECSLLTELCLNGGVCNNIPGSFECECAAGFKVQVCSESSTSNNVVVAVSVTVVLVVLLIAGIAIGYCVYQKRRRQTSPEGISKMYMYTCCGIFSSSILYECTLHVSCVTNPCNYVIVYM